MNNRQMLVSLAIGLFLSSGAVFGQKEGPQLTVEPDVGPAGGTVSASGSGFVGDCEVRLFFDGLDGSPLGVAKVGRDGSFSARAAIPEDASEGQHAILAQGMRYADEFCGDPSGHTARASFQVAASPPTLSIDAGEGRPGMTVDMEGSNFCPDAGCSPVRVFIEDQVVADDVTVRSDGSFSVRAMVPAVDAAGEVLVEAVQTGTDGEEIRAVSALVVTVKPNVRQDVPQ